jgi:hypothetical protein
MNDGNTIKNFTAADIEKYHNGLLSASAMHDLEKAALDDPFLADALEGYNTSGVNVAADLNELKERLAEKTNSVKVVPLKSAGAQRKFPWMRAAAVVLVMAGAGILAQRMFVNKKDNAGIAKAEEPKKEEIKAADTSGIVNGSVTSGEKEKPSAFLDTETKPGGNGVTEKSGETAITNTGAFTTENKPSAPPLPVKVNDETAVTKIKTDSTKYWGADIAKTDAAFKKKQKSEIADKDADGVKDQYDREAKQAAQGAVATNRNVTANNQNQRFYNNQATNLFRGRVTDANNVGLPFARVSNPTDNNAGTYTDVRGYFNLTYPDTVLDVQVKSIGFENGMVQLRSTALNNLVKLEDDKAQADVVVGIKKPNAEKRRDANMKLVEPEPADGWDNYDTYLANNLEIPDELKSKPTGGAEVEVSFEVNKNGEPVNIKVEKSLCGKCDKEAIRLVKEGPKWRRNANKKGRTTVTISF